jgi:acetyl esterase/lipase
LVASRLFSIFHGTGSASLLSMTPTATTIAIPTMPDCACAATLHRQDTPHAPLVLHLHAGAFVSAPQSQPRVAGMLVEAGATVVSLHYPLAPEHPFPQGIEAAYAALVWLHRRRRRLAHGDAAVFIAGEEAGGNLAAAVSLMARDRAEPPLAGQILFSPMLDACVATASLRRAQAGPVGCRFADGWRRYLSRASDALHPYATPGAAVRLAGLPATLLVTANDDPFRDETLAYARRLRDQGVTVDALTLAPPTGFPAAYMTPPAACDARWADAVRPAIRRFLALPPIQPQEDTR